MEYLINIILSIAVLFCFAYAVLIASYCYAWVKTKVPVLKPVSLQTRVTVIVAARNEEEVIENCIHSILKQSYPANLFELIIVDDASEDVTNSKVQQFCNSHKNVKLISLKKDDKYIGKKNAINVAIHESTGELIVTTDADCVMDKNWLSTIVSYYEQTQAKMIVAPVVFHDEKNTFEKMQTLEFMSLITSGAASLYFNKATLCNGANLAYTKKVFYEVDGFNGINKTPSGDDVLLMYKIKNKYPGSIKFLKHKDALVYTKAKSNLHDFVNQRKRWASKGFKALNGETKLVAFIVYAFNVLIFILMMMSLFYYPICKNYFAVYKIFFILLAIKCFVDFLLLFLATSFFQ